MAKQLQLRKGTATEHNSFIGAIGEVTVDTTNKTLRVHDGSTVGGTRLATLTGGLVPAAQLPAATTSAQGASKIATTAIAQAGTNDNDIMTPKKVKDQVSIGGRVHATAYISIVGTTVTILGSKNVASVILQSTGVFKVTTLTNMDNLNFTILSTSSLINGQGASTGVTAEWLNADGTNKRTLNSFEMVSLGSQSLGNPRYFGVTVIC